MQPSSSLSRHTILQLHRLKQRAALLAARGAKDDALVYKKEHVRDLGETRFSVAPRKACTGAVGVLYFGEGGALLSTRNACSSISFGLQKEAL